MEDQLEPRRHPPLRAGLVLAALGVVFGDIGTSPLYAFRECFLLPHGVDLSEGNVKGVLSLLLWSLILIVVVKYLLIVMRADNRGEGGVLALLALLHPRLGSGEKEKSPWLLWCGIFGAALLFGDGVITPAISVLSAVEGLKVATPLLEPFVLPCTVGILIGLFLIQKRGTGRIGGLFGPIIAIWFIVLALLGVRGILLAPHILESINPQFAVAFFGEHGWEGFRILSAVFLCVTGVEALYADMGHFGAKPIRIAWFFLVFPALVLNYFGQGALVLTDPAARESPFFMLAPQGSLYFLVGLATAATVIASQALISGAFSLASQAIQLGILPRMTIRHTSREHIGQIYVTQVNWALLVFTIWLVLEFRTSSNLAAAYGIAVSATMIITALLLFFVMRRLWRWSLALSLAVSAPIFLIDLAFLKANLLKIVDGGWFPLAVGIVLFTVMTTWRSGRNILRERLQEKLPGLDVFVQEIPEMVPLCVPGVAIYMNQDPDVTPPALVYNIKHNHVIHELNLIVSVVVEEAPFVSPMRRVGVERLREGVFKVVLRFGFMDDPQVPRALALCRGAGIEFDVEDATFFFGRENLIATPRPGMAMWRENLFGFMMRNAQKASRFFGIRADQVVEIGFEVEI